MSELPSEPYDAETLALLEEQRRRLTAHEQAKAHARRVIDSLYALHGSRHSVPADLQEVICIVASFRVCERSPRWDAEFLAVLEATFRGLKHRLEAAS